MFSVFPLASGVGIAAGECARSAAEQAARLERRGAHIMTTFAVDWHNAVDINI